MKEKLKYLAAVLLAGSILIGFIPIISVSIINLSVMDIMKVGLGFYNGSSDEARMIYGSIRTYLEPYAWCIAGGLAVILIEAFLTAVLSKKKAYVISLISCIINCAAVLLVIVLIRIKLNEVQSALIFLDAADIIRFHMFPMIIWGIIYFIILLLSIVGICLWRAAEKKEIKSEELYLDQIRMLEEENNMRKYTDEVNPEAYRSALHPDEKISPVAPPVQAESIPETDYRSEQRRENQEKSGMEILEKFVYRGEAGKYFTGAIIGEKGIYAGKAYPLIERKEIFFRMDNEQVLFNPYEEVENLAGIYFIGEYNEYCVESYRKGFVFLESGQPLGKDRQYFLPRGTGLYLKDKNNQFTLA